MDGSMTLAGNHYHNQEKANVAELEKSFYD